MKIIKTIGCASLMLAGFTSQAGDNTGINFYESEMYNVAKVYFLKQLNTVSLPEEKAEACYYLGESYLQLNKPDSAKFYYKKGLEILPDYMLNQIGLEKLALKSLTGKEDLSKAETSFKNIIKTNKKDIRLQLAVAQAYLYSGNVEKAQSFIKDAKKTDAKSGLPYIVEGDMLLFQKKYGEAAAKYDMAIYFSPDLVGAYMKSARLYMSINKDAVFEKLETIGEKAPEFSGRYRLLGELYEMQGNSKLAAENYAKFIDAGYYDSDHLLRYAGILYYDKQYEKMLPIVRIFIQRQPDNLVANRLLAYGLSKTEPGEASINAIKKFVETMPEERLIIQDYLCYAEQLEVNKHYEDAAVNYKKVLKKDETKKSIYQNIADMYLKSQQLDSALRYYDFYMNFTGQPDPTVYFQIGRGYYSLASTDSLNSVKWYKTADSLFTILTTVAPTSFSGWFWRARTNASLDPETTQGLAQPYYEKVIELTIDQPDRYKTQLIESYKYFGYLHYLKAEEITKKHNGNAKFAKEEYLKVRDFFSKIQALEPSDTMARKVLEDIPKY